LSSDRIGYTPPLGIAELRHAVASHTQAWYGIDVDPANVVITTGSSGGFLLGFLAAFDAGDVVAIARPGYPAYRNILASLDCTLLEFECGAEVGYVPSLEMLAALDPKPAGLILASPANPTGAMVSPSRLADVAAWCARNDVLLISDEIYHGITYDAAGACAWQFGRDALVVNSFSKYFSMTGWRLGWLLVPDRLLDAVGRLAGNYAICPPTLSQFAALAAFDSYEELDANVRRYQQNRHLLLDALPAIGLSRFAPADGAFYIYADVSGYTSDSLHWVRNVLDEIGVALAPGLDFDTANGQMFARMSFASDTAEIERAVEALGKYLARR
jgi:aspartate/methionine/tyrosine aminotransferase